jgi:hypothetical protein
MILIRDVVNPNPNHNPFLFFIMFDSDQDTLTSRFDVDRDGDIDMNEFFSFIEGEKGTLNLDPQHESEQLQRTIQRGRAEKDYNAKYDPKYDPKVFVPGIRSYRQSRSPARNGTRKPARKPSRSSSNRSDSKYSPTHGRYATSDSDRDDQFRGDDEERLTGVEGQGQSKGPPSYTEDIDRVEEEKRREEEKEGSEIEKYLYKSKGIAEGKTVRNGNNEQREKEDQSYHETKGVDRDYSDEDRNVSPRAHSTSHHDQESNLKERNEFDFDEINQSNNFSYNSEVTWATKMLRAQSHIESRLGKRYY